MNFNGDHDLNFCDGVFMQKQYLSLCMMRNSVHRGQTILQLELKNHWSTTMLQLHPPKCNSYATTFYNTLFNKWISMSKNKLIVW